MIGDIDLEYLCTEIFELLESNNINEDTVPNLWEMIERFSNLVLIKHNKFKMSIDKEDE